MSNPSKNQRYSDFTDQIIQGFSYWGDGESQFLPLNRNFQVITQ